MPPSVTFDLDGTLYDTRRHILRIGLRLWPHRKVLRAWQEAVEHLRGAHPPDLAEVLLDETARRSGRDREDVRGTVSQVLGKIWVDHLRPRHVRPGILEALDLLDGRRIPRAVVSDHEPRAKLAALGLDDGWAALVDATALGALKPDPVCLSEAVRRMGGKPQDLIHIGDRPETDGAAASRLGARFLQFPSPNREAPSLRRRLEALLHDSPADG